MRFLEFPIGHYLCAFATDYPVLITTIRALLGVAGFAKNVFASLASPQVAVIGVTRYEINKAAYGYKNVPNITDEILLAHAAIGDIYHKSTDMVKQNWTRISR
ncbi:MAG: hypothetical protein ACKVRN_01420 [Pyrinomonadaceae bacterium]